MDAMEAKATEIFDNTPQYQADGKRGMFIIQLKSPTHPNRWDAMIQPFGAIVTPPEVKDGKVVWAGISFDGVAHGKAAYARRTGTNSGAEEGTVPMAESHWEGAVVSADGNCVCAFSGVSGEDDVLIAKAGIEAYNALS